MPAEPESRKYWLKVNRIEALADGIFAISMTLLVLGLEVPDIPEEAAATTLHETLARDWPRFEDYMISFLLLALFWLSHHRQFNYIRRVTQTYLWLNILALMFVALVPFSTSLMSTYDGVHSSALIFEANLFVLGLIYFAMWTYASTDYRLIDALEISQASVRTGRQLTLVVPAVSVVAMVLALFASTWSETAYIACPFISNFLRKRGG